MTLDIQVLAWDRRNNVERLNRLMESQPYTINNWISNGNTNIYPNDKKKLRKFASTQQDHILIQEWMT